MTNLVVQGVLPIVIVLMTRQVVDSLGALIGNNGDATLFRAALLNVLAMGLLLLMNEGLSSGRADLRTALAEQIQD